MSCKVGFKQLSAVVDPDKFMVIIFTQQVIEGSKKSFWQKF